MRKIEPEMLLWFGKFANVPLDEIDYDYLVWAVDNWNPETTQYEIVEKELIRRKNQNDNLS